LEYIAYGLEDFIDGEDAMYEAEVLAVEVEEDQSEVFGDLKPSGDKSKKKGGKQDKKDKTDKKSPRKESPGKAGKAGNAG